MPLYQIHHSCSLSSAQQQAIASGITNLHCSTFSAPSAFVNITFHPTSTISPQIYVGGTPQRTNYILGHLRPRPNNAEKLNHVVKAIMSIWNEHARPVDRLLVQTKLGQTTVNLLEKAKEVTGVGYRPKSGDGRLDDERALHNVFLFEDLAAGAEQGFVLPVAGEDGEWAKENMAEFARRAADGDESMKKLVQEYKAKL
jgi:hypothetical protein